MSQEEKTIEMKDADQANLQPAEAQPEAVSEPIKEESKEEALKGEQAVKEVEEPTKEEENQAKEGAEGEEAPQAEKKGEIKNDQQVVAPLSVLAGEEANQPEPKFTGEVAVEPPALRRLNGDSSWLLSLPLIDQESKYSSFNLLIDPWFSPAQQVDFHPLFSAQTRIESAEFGNIGQLEEFLAKEAEQGASQGKKSPSPQVDGILISHPFTDHMHEETLLDPSVRLDIPFYGTKDSVPLLRKLFDSKIARAAMEKEDAPTASHRHIHIIPTAQKNHLSWESEPNQPTPLPSGFKILHAPASEPWHFSVSKGPAWHKLHGGIALIWETSRIETGELLGNGGQKEYKRTFDSLLYSPHGISSNSVPSWLSESRFKTLVHCLDEQTLPKLMGGVISLGLPNIKEISNTRTFPNPAYRPNVLIASHDEKKNSKGLVSNSLKRVEHSKEEAKETLKLPKLREGEVEKYQEITIFDPAVGEAVSLTQA